MKLHRAPVLAVLALGALLAAGCDSSGGGSAAGGSVERSVAGTQGPSLLARIADAPATVSFGGKRHVRIRYESQGQPAVLE